MRKIVLILLTMILLLPAPAIMAQVSEKNVNVKDISNLSRDSLVQLLKMQDSLLQLKKHDSVNMANLIAMLEFNRDSLNSALNQSIYRQKLDSADRMKHYFSIRDFNRRSRQGFYNPIGIIDNDSVRSSVKEMVDLVFEDTAYNPKPLLLKSSFDRLVRHLANDSIYFRIINTKLDTIPFVLKKNRVDSAAFFVMNSSDDSAKLFLRGLDKNTIYMWVGDDLLLKHLLKNKSAPEGISVHWQDPNKFRIARRPVPVPAAKLWFLRSELTATVNQYAFINWTRGGNSNIALTMDVKGWANYAKGNIKWENYFWLIYGLQKTELLDLRKSADHITMISNLSHKAFKNFDYTLGTAFDTQSFKGFAYPNDSVPVSKFMAPGDLKINLGLTYRPNPTLTINMSPISSQFRFVLDTAMIDQTKYGLKANQRANAQLGASARIIYTKTFTPRVSMTNVLDLFSNYIDHPEMVNFDWKMDLQLKINKYIYTTIHTEMFYDNRMLVPLYQVKDGKKIKIGEGKRIQFNEILGITLKYIL